MPGVAGRSGRKPKPLERKRAAGNPGKRSLNEAAPDYSGLRNIDPPEWLEGPGRELWELLAPQLCEQRVLRMTDVQNLEIYCAAYGRFREAQVELSRSGLVIEGSQGGKIKNPAATIVAEATRQMATFGSMLGLDPSSRQRLMGEGGQNKDNPFAALTNTR